MIALELSYSHVVAEGAVVEEKKGYVEKNVQTWLFFIVFAAIFFRLFNITTSSLWTDEISTLWVSSAPTFGAVWERASVTQGMHPAYFIVQHLVLSLLPPSEGVLRGLSCAASIISVFLVFWLAKTIFADDTRALLAAAIFAIHSDSIYYAQEARPYALGIMFALLSQIFFLHLKRLPGARSVLPYVLCSVASVYMHYTFASLFIFQNAYVAGAALLRSRGVRLFEDAPGLKLWIPLQSVCAALVAFSLPHVSGLYGMRAAWTWVKDLDGLEAVALFLSMFDLKMLAAMLGVGVVFFIFERFSAKDIVCRLGAQPTLLVLLWIVSPFVFVFAASRILNTSFFDPRYMLFAMPAYYLLLANLLDVFRSDVLRTAFPGVYLIIYLGSVSVPAYMDGGSFCRRIPHDWRAALGHIRQNHVPGDGFLMRYGEVKENWIPPPNQIVQEYVTSPFHSFYWIKSPSDKVPPVINMTYTWDKDFFNYYDRVFAELVKRRRVWLIGVDPPNTNYRFSTVAQFMQDEFSFRKLWESDFSGVYVALLESNPVLRQKALVPAYYKELMEEMKKQRKEGGDEKR